MKSIRGCKNSEGFFPALSSGDFEFLKLPGKETRARLIHELFESGKEAEARKALRETLAELTKPPRGRAKTSGTATGANTRGRRVSPPTG
ncbi:MAG TPA: hypothetical protein VF799_11695 [Geobacteraceae bacterium]